MNDIFLLALAFGYVFIILVIGEWLRRGLGLSVEFTRKLIHIGVGMIAFPLVILFREWYYAIIPPAVFILVNYVSYRRELFKGMETGERNQLGTVYFPIAFVLLIVTLWAKPALFVASLMPLTWGDAFAAILGRRFGRHWFIIFGQMRSLEGSGAMFVFSLISTCTALVIFGVPFDNSLALAALTAIAATIVESISPRGIDNLTIPLISAIALVAADWAVTK